ncbi:alpha/beta hydrolase [Rhodanobacter sp. L36]|uniref:alpha/beta fold hydrolase n=1 Tax=Rhodanobacter sp. L36 TaxID=1747221 RepID=UPI00131C6C29|nr:alpha/beta hydrolase [Rhodanobacter sp. L36]
MTVLLILPGLDGTATMHSAFVDVLSSVFDSVEVVSYPVDQQLDYLALERLVRTSMPSSKPFVLLGESFSGPVAISIAANPPKNLMGLVLSTTFATSPILLPAPFAALARFAPVRTLPLHLLSWFLLGRWATPELKTELRSALKMVSPDVLRFRAMAALRANALARCKEISLPVLNLSASSDRLLSRRAGKKISSAIAHCTTVNISGPHLLLQAVPQACAQAVFEFASQLGC